MPTSLPALFLYAQPLSLTAFQQGLGLVPHIPPGVTVAPILKTGALAVSSYTHTVYVVVPFTGSPKAFWASGATPLPHFQANCCFVVSVLTLTSTLLFPALKHASSGTDGQPAARVAVGVLVGLAVCVAVCVGARVTVAVCVGVSVGPPGMVICPS